MDKNAIKKYAVWARRELIARVSQKAEQYGITEKETGDMDDEIVNGRLLTLTEQVQRSALIRRIRASDYKQVMEEVAYTWFNRFCALRFMEVNNYLPTRVRVFTDANNAFKPEIIDEAIHMELDGLDMEKVYAFKEKNQTEELFKYLIIVQCNALNSILPGMFQWIEDYTELLFPDNLLREGSVIEQLIAMIPERDWLVSEDADGDSVQIIGWLYQYYNTEPKDQVFANLKKNIKIGKRDIPAATQLFTPDWIVRYMVENSLGRLWVEGHPNDDLKKGWKYYLEEAEQEPQVQEELAKIRAVYAQIKPEDIKCIDPCMGSGHILVYMFDVLVQIYQAYGYTTRDAVSSIIENNLYGLDIDDRAAQLAYFAVMMKARQYDRRFFTRGIQPHVMAIRESADMPADAWGFFGTEEDIARRVYAAFVDAKEYGSLIDPNVTLEELDKLRKRLNEMDSMATMGSLGTQAIVGAAINAIYPLIELARMFVQKYDVVCTNPPYMGGGNMGTRLSAFVKDAYPDSKSDLSTCFMEKALNLCAARGMMAMINIPVWMSLSSYEKLRKKMLVENTIINMVHPGRGIFGSDFGTTAFVIGKSHISAYKGSYRRLFDIQGEVRSIEELEQSLLAGKGRHVAQQDKFNKIPGAPVAYWMSEKFVSIFELKSIKDVAFAGIGMRTGDNDRFLRLWHEIEISKFYAHCKSAQEVVERNVKWVPYNKGGEFRRWYGNNNYVVNWEDNGRDIKENTRRVYPQLGDNLGWKISNEQYYFMEGVTWTVVSARSTSFRRYYEGAIISNSGQSVIAQPEMLDYFVGLLNTKIVERVLSVLSPTLGFESGYINKIPVIIEEENKERVCFLTNECVSISRRNWDSYEASWDFERHPVVSKALSRFHWNSESITVRECFETWKDECVTRFCALKSNEEELNRIFIDIYGLQDEMTPDVADRDVTVHRIFDTKDDVPEAIQGSAYVRTKRDEIVSLISYAVGCMFGRYSLSKPGLIYAGGEWDESAYSSEFMPDKDGILPISDDEYFTDDIVAKFIRFIEVVFGKATLEENLRFIADALGGKGTPREVIRSYFLNDFYTDHLKTYQKRPIYWLFDSGKKNGFKALIYMHRYAPDTIARIRTDYVHEQQSRYRTAIEDLEKRVAGATTAERVKLNKQIAKIKAQADELHTYEEKIHHLADQMIAIDLDDGVKVNYAKFADVLGKIK